MNIGGNNTLPRLFKTLIDKDRNEEIHFFKTLHCNLKVKFCL